MDKENPMKFKNPMYKPKLSDVFKEFFILKKRELKAFFCSDGMRFIAIYLSVVASVCLTLFLLICFPVHFLCLIVTAILVALCWWIRSNWRKAKQNVIEDQDFDQFRKHTAEPVEPA